MAKKSVKAKKSALLKVGETLGGSREPGALFITKRIDAYTYREQIALWVRMPNGNTYNISDIDEEQLTQKMLRVVEHAFSLGIDYAYARVAQTRQTERATAFPTEVKEYATLVSGGKKGS